MSDDSNTRKVYGFASDPSRVSVVAKMGGGGPIAVDMPEWAAVEIHDPEPDNTFTLPPEKARHKAKLLREHSDDESAGRLLASRIEHAVAEAEAMERER